MRNLIASTLTAATLASALSAQAPCFNLNLGTDLQMSDDQITQGLALGFSFPFNGTNYTDICVDSNGSIYLGATTTAFPDYIPDVSVFLASNEPRICPLWTDFQADATGSGHIYFNAVPASGPNPAYALITWAGVYEFFQTTPIEMQVRLDGSGTVTVTYGNQGALGSAFGTDILIGMTPGLGAAANPVSFATRPFVSASNTFHQLIALPGTNPTGVQMSWLPTSPGFVVSDVACTPNSLPAPARIESVGRGCPSQPTVYELFDFNNPVDVSGLDLTFVPNGIGSYVVLPGIAGPFYNGLTNNLGAGDDTTHAVSLPFAFPHAGSSVNNIVVSSNGFLTLGVVDNGPGCCSGDPFAFLAGEPCISAWWSDLNPSNAGGVYASLDSNTGEFVITWSGVPEFGNGGSNTFQIALDPSGTFKIRLQNVGTLGHDFLCGYTRGQGAFDLGSTDLSAITALDLGPGGGGAPLQQTEQFGNTPQIGATVNIDVTGISAAPQGNAVFLIIGFTELNPGVDLGIIGAAGCNAYLLPGPTDLQFLNITLGAPTTTFSLTVPNDPNLIGAQAVSEAVSDDATANAFGWKFSNGLRWTVGI